MRPIAIGLAAVVALLLVIVFASNPSLAGAVFKLDFATQAIGIAIPLTLAALCAAVTERSGVIDLAIEAKWLFGAFAAASLSHATGSPAIGLVAGMAMGVAVAAVQLWLALRLSDQPAPNGRVLLVDMDPQGHGLLATAFEQGNQAATESLGIRPGATVTSPKRYQRLAGFRATARSRRV